MLRPILAVAALLAVAYAPAASAAACAPIEVVNVGTSPPVRVTAYLCYQTYSWTLDPPPVWKGADCLFVPAVGAGGVSVGSGQYHCTPLVGIDVSPVGAQDSSPGVWLGIEAAGSTTETPKYFWLTTCWLGFVAHALNWGTCSGTN